jgi:tetratricopeptide (TPR) repeat protein
MTLSQTLQSALQFHQSGNLQQAELLYRQILQSNPLHFDALHLLGVIALQLGRHELAIEQIRTALRARPNHAEAHNNLGSALAAIGQLPEAVACFRQAVLLKPDNAEAHNNLGNALRQQGKPAEAMASLQQALRLRPDHAEALTNLGIACHDLGRFDEAVEHYQRAVRLKPDFATAHNNLALALREQGKLEEAISHYRQALRLKPDFADACCNLGNVLRDQRKLEEAISHFRQALLLKPDHADACNSLGNALQDQGKLAEAIDCHQRALSIQPGFPKAHCSLGWALQQLGDFAGAEQAFRAVLRDHPRNADALGRLAFLLSGRLPAADRSLLEECLVDANLRDADRSKLLFSLAQVCDARGEYEQAAAQLRRANALTLDGRCRRGQGYDLDIYARFIENLMAAFTPAFFDQVRGFGLDTERPVFIVGLPRSGTTLTEQILAAHSQVYGAGELSLAAADFLSLVEQPTQPGSFAALSGLQLDSVRVLAQRHLDQLGQLNCTAARVVDKMPDNYAHLGLLATLFPKAKFIHCRRDLRDVAVSCWMTELTNVRWSNDPDHIVARFRDYRRLMAHWRSALPVSMLEFNYEETVTDLPGAARRLVEWCGLDWEPACLTFHESIRPIRSSSVMQARQPIYTRSVGRWRNYERELGALFAALEPLLEEGC